MSAGASVDTGRKGPGMHSKRTVKEVATKVRFFDNGVPSQLYTLWRGQVHRGIQNWNCFGSAEAGTNWWNDFCEWAAGQPTMAPWGLVRYSQEEVRWNVRILCDDVVKKAWNSRQSMWDMIYQARAAYTAANPDLEHVIEPPKWPLPDAQELRLPTTQASYMPRNLKATGKVSQTYKNATSASNAEKEIRAAWDRARDS